MATAVGVELLGGQNWLALPHGSVALPWHQNPAGHGLQRALVTSVALASYVPCGHGCFLSQYGCAAASWNLPDGHGLQSLALASFEKCIALHGAHLRSDVDVAGATWCWPGTHVVCFTQKA